MKKALLGLLVMFSLVVTANALEYTNERGNVQFDHEGHQGFNTCNECHPPFEQSFDDTVSKRQIAHKVCRECHEEMAAGPTTCDGCHGAFQGEDRVMEFNNRRGLVTFNHTTHQEREGDCMECHPAFPEKYDDSVSIKKESHKTCKACHKRDGGPTKCNTCHIR